MLFISFFVLGAFNLFQEVSLLGLDSGFSPELSPSDKALEYPQLASILTDARFDSIYKEFIIACQVKGSKEASLLATKRGLLNILGELVFTLELNTTDTTPVKNELETRGIKVTAISEKLMDIAIPLELIQETIDPKQPGGIFNEIADMEYVQLIRSPTPSEGIEPSKLSVPDLNLKGLDCPMIVGDIDSESLSMIGASNWHELGYTGKGVRIGILDKGFKKYSELLGTDLPNNIVGKSFYYPYDLENGTTEHGTAVAEIVYDIAPEAELYFAPYGTETEMDQAVNWLLAQGVDIIQNSTGSIKGPFDGTSSKAKLVDRVVESGVLWINASGNAAEGHYRGTFSDADGNGFHEFVSDKDLMPFVTPIGEGMIYLNWDDYENGNQDFDLYIYDADQNKIASSRNVQNGPGSSPVEGILYDFPDNGPYYAAFYAVNATRPVVFDFFVWDGVVKLSSAEYSLLAPSDARRSLTVGGVYWKDDVLEDYSSQGPTHDGRLKPELVAPTRVTSVAYGKAWTGTSASAPHVSGASALVLQAFPDFGPDQIIEFLEDRAIDLGPDGPDNAFGYGRLWLGFGPESQDAPIPTSEVQVPVPEETATQPISEKNTPISQQTATPSLEVDEGIGISLGLIVCVMLPGLLGLGGIGLLGIVIYKMYSRAMPSPSYAAPVYPPIRPPEVYREPWISPKVEEENNCQRCGSAFRPHARFCSVCGSPLSHEKPPFRDSKYCKYCGLPLRQESRFCTRCGKPRK